METIIEYWSFIKPHWPGIMFIFVITVIAQTLKTRIFTRQLAARRRVVFWLRRIFPIILLGLGIGMGLVWPGEASPGISAISHKCLYFSGCVCISIVGFNIFKEWFKKKYDIDVGLQELDK